MLENLQFTKWFARLCVKFNVHFGKSDGATRQTHQSGGGQEVDYDEVYNTATTVTNPDAITGIEDHSGDVLLNESMQLRKSGLCMSILGYFNLCVEFRPDVLHEFI